MLNNNQQINKKELTKATSYEQLVAITVFTPTYNRAGLLPRLYDSLKQQTFTDFEWIIVDDGSVDKTEEVVNKQIIGDDHSFQIKYIKKENHGKHTAVNVGVKHAQGELFMIADSDDFLPNDALNIVSKEYQAVKDDPFCGGVCGYMAHSNGVVIGKGCDADFIDANSIDMRYKYHIQGDMKEVFRTDVLREFPFPEIDNERFCPEQLVWFRIAQKYYLRVFNKVIYTAEYLADGLTSNIVRIRMNSPVASCMTYSEMLNYDIPFVQKIKAAINYYRFASCLKNNTDNNQLSSPCLCWAIFKPLGYLMHMRDLSI